MKRGLKVDGIDRAFNRTNVELKHFVGCERGLYRVSFNRTNVELKRETVLMTDPGYPAF